METSKTKTTENTITTEESRPSKLFLILLTILLTTLIIVPLTYWVTTTYLLSDDVSTKNGEDDTADGDSSEGDQNIDEDGSEEELIKIAQCNEFSMKKPEGWNYYSSAEDSEYFKEHSLFVDEGAFVLERNGYYLLFNYNTDESGGASTPVTDQDDYTYALSIRTPLEISGDDYYLNKQHADLADVNLEDNDGPGAESNMHLSIYKEDKQQFSIGAFEYIIERNDCAYRVSKYSTTDTKDKSYGDTPSNVQQEMVAILESITW